MVIGWLRPEEHRWFVDGPDVDNGSHGRRRRAFGRGNWRAIVASVLHLFRLLCRLWFAVVCPVVGG